MDTTIQQIHGRKNGSGEQLNSPLGRIQRMAYKILMLSLILVLATGCSDRTKKAVKEESDSNKSSPRRPDMDQQVVVAPQRCRIVGTLVEINPELLKEGNGPCTKFPCRGIVRIDSILGYGSAFGNPLAIGQRVNVHFAFTLAPTKKELFPNMTEAYPGLEVNSRFKADVESLPEMNTSADRIRYQVYDYLKLQ
jgi:hypothetical protein